MMKTIIWMLFGFSLILEACTHEPIPIPISCVAEFSAVVRDSCLNIPISQNPFGYKIVTPDTLPRAVLYNPINEDEIIFISHGEKQRSSGTGSESFNSLWKLNICTGEKILLVDNVYELYDINLKEWILWSSPDFHIWAIKTNGDSLKQLTASNISFDAKWFPDQHHFSFFQNGGATDAFVSMNFYSGAIDTIDFFSERVDKLAWSKKQDSAIVLLYQNGEIGLKLVDLISGQEEVVFRERFDPFGSPPNLISSIIWPAFSNKIYWIQAANLYELDLVNREIRMLFDGCNGNQIINFSKSTESSKLIGTWRKSTVLVPNDTLLVEAFLLQLDLDKEYPYDTKILNLTN